MSEHVPTRFVERVEAMQHDGSAASINAILKWLGEGYVETSDSTRTVYEGDWVVRGRVGDVRVLTPDAFALRYEKEEEMSKRTAEGKLSLSDPEARALAICAASRAVPDVLARAQAEYPGLDRESLRMVMVEAGYLADRLVAEAAETVGSFDWLDELVEWARNGGER